MNIDLNKIAPGLLIKKRRVFEGAGTQLVSIPKDREKIFGKYKEIYFLAGKCSVIIPIEDNMEITTDKYIRIMDSIEKIIGGK